MSQDVLASAALLARGRTLLDRNSGHSPSPASAPPLPAAVVHGTVVRNLDMPIMVPPGMSLPSVEKGAAERERGLEAEVRALREQVAQEQLKTASVVDNVMTEYASKEKEMTAQIKNLQKQVSEPPAVVMIVPPAVAPLPPVPMPQPAPTPTQEQRPHRKSSQSMIMHGEHPMAGAQLEAARREIEMLKATLHAETPPRRESSVSVHNADAQSISDQSTKDPIRPYTPTMGSRESERMRASRTAGGGSTTGGGNDGSFANPLRKIEELTMKLSESQRVKKTMEEHNHQSALRVAELEAIVDKQNRQILEMQHSETLAGTAVVRFSEFAVRVDEQTRVANERLHAVCISFRDFSVKHVSVHEDAHNEYNVGKIDKLEMSPHRCVVLNHEHDSDPHARLEDLVRNLTDMCVFLQRDFSAALENTVRLLGSYANAHAMLHRSAEEQLATIDDAHHAITQLYGDKVRLTQEVEGLNDKIMHMLLEVEVAVTSQRSAEEHKSQMSEQLRGERENMVECLRKISVAESHVRHAYQERDRSVAALAEEVSERSKHEQRLSETMTDRDLMESRYRAAEREIRNMRDVRDRLDGDSRRHTISLVDKEQEVEKIRVELSACEGQNRSLEERILRMRVDTENVTTEIREKERHNSLLARSVEEKDRMVAVLEAEAKKLEHDIVELHSEIQTVRLSEAAFMREAGYFKTMLQQHENKELEEARMRQLLFNENEIHTLRDDNIKLRGEVQVLTAELTSLKDVHRRLSDQIQQQKTMRNNAVIQTERVVVRNIHCQCFTETHSVGVESTTPPEVVVRTEVVYRDRIVPEVVYRDRSPPTPLTDQKPLTPPRTPPQVPRGMVAASLPPPITSASAEKSLDAEKLVNIDTDVQEIKSLLHSLMAAAAQTQKSPAPKVSLRELPPPTDIETSPIPAQIAHRYSQQQARGATVTTSQATSDLVDLHKELYSLMRPASQTTLYETPMISPQRHPAISSHEVRAPPPPQQTPMPRRVSATAFPPPFTTAATSPSDAAAMARQLLHRAGASN